MKKSLTLFAGIAFVAILFTSCKKDYTCNCILSGTTTPYTYVKVSKTTATDACNSANTTWALLGGSCKLN